ncbi:MAG: hypothetical protein AAF721_06725 [Myxococcota bacterium]
MFVTAFRWFLAVFAFASGAAKLYGIEVEQQGAVELGVPYVALRILGAVHVAAGMGLSAGRPTVGAALLGASYLPVVAVALARGQLGLALGAVGASAVALAFVWLGTSRR